MSGMLDFFEVFAILILESLRMSARYYIITRIVLDDMLDPILKTP